MTFPRHFYYLITQVSVSIRDLGKQAWCVFTCLTTLFEQLFALNCPFFLCLGSIDEGVTEGLPTLQSTSGTNAHADDDDRYIPTCCAVFCTKCCAVINLPSLNPTMFSCSYIRFCVLIKVQSVPGGADALEECRWWKPESAYSVLFVSYLFPGSTGEER